MALRDDIRKLKEQMMPSPKPQIKFVFDKDIPVDTKDIYVLFTLKAN